MKRHRQPLRAVVGIALVAALAPAAGSQAQPLASDPSADSPAGFVYQIPLDTARGDAAPRRHRTGRSGTAQQDAPQRAGGPTSAIRSENNFGSSSIVPGAGSVLARHGAGAVAGGSAVGAGGAAGGGGGTGASGGSAKRGGAGQDADRRSGREMGSGSGSATIAAGASSPSGVADGPGPSPSVAIVLLLLTTVVGLVAGVAAARARHDG